MSNYNTLKTADTINAISIVDGAITTSKLNASVTTLIVSGSGPKVAAITYPGNDLAADPAGGQTITLTGTGFVSGCSVFVGTTQASVVTVVSATSVTFTAPALAAATYTLYLVNPDGGTATIVPGISYSGTPIWSTAAGTLGSVYEYAAISNTVAATGDGSIIYSVFSGTLPTGSSLNTSTGVISGTSPASAGATTYTFVIRATDAQLQDSDRTFSITINTDTVTWSTPAANSTVTLGKDVASSTTLLATSAAGNAITYTSTTLPAGLTISGATVTGTPTVIASTTSTFTATAATTGRTATRTINWTVSVASDTYFPYTTLLLSGATATETFIADASVNNFALTITGDTKPNNFNPYTPGYYSNYFDGSGDYLSVAAGNAAFAFGTGDFTVEFWVYPVVFGPVASSAPTMVAVHDGANSTGWQLYLSDGQIGIRTHYNNVMYLTASMAAYLGVWTHIAYVRSSGTQKIYMNGVEKCSTSDVWNWTDTTLKIASQAQDFNGYFSNVRLVKGTALYTAAFTPPTAPLTAIANTSVLTCQSNRFIDNSTNAFTITKVGGTTVNSFTPFVPNAQYAAYGSTYFDGNADYLSVPSNAAFGFGTGDFTVEGWYYLTAIVTDQALLMLGTGANGAGPIYCGWWLKYSSLGALIFYRYDGTETTYSFSTTLVVNTWYHIACSRSGTSLRMFLNGTQIGATASSNLSFNNANSDPLQIGKCITGQGTFYYNGYISNIRIVKGVAVYTSAFTLPTAPLTAITNTSLLTCQTNQPASNSMFLDSSTNAFAVTGAGNTSAGTFTPYGANWSNYFDGTSDGLVMPAGLSTAMGAGFAGNIISFEMWIFPTSFTNGGAGEGNGIMGAYAAVSANGRWLVSMERSVTTTAKFSFTYTTGTGSSVTVESTASAITLNQWNHIAITVDATTAASSTIKLFANGVLLNTFTGQNMSTQTAYYRPVYIGDVQSQYVAAMVGYISNFRILKGAFAYTGNYTVPTAPLTAIANTVLLTCQSNSLVDNSANVFTISKYGDTSVQRFSPFSPQTQTAITNSVYYGTKTDYISTPATAALTTFTGDFTFECWVNPTDTSISTNWGIWDSRQNGQTASAMIFTLQNLASPVTGQWRLSYYYGSGTQTYGTGIVLANQWTHVAFVRSGSTLTYYVNGVAGGTATVSGTQTGSATSNPVYIGTKDGSLSGYGNIGYISNFRIVKGVAVYTGNFTVPTAPLSATQSSGTNIAAITGTQTSLLTFQSSTLIDNSTNAYVLTPATTTIKPRTLNPFGFTNTSAAYSAATYGGSAYFDGASDTLTLPSNAAFAMGTGNFTIEFWINTSNIAQGGYVLQTDTAANTLYVSLSGSTIRLTNVSTAFAVTPTLLSNTWYHIAVVRTGTSSVIYTNGIAGTPVTCSIDFTQAGPSIGNNNYLGYISNVRIVKGVAVYTSNFVPPTAPLSAITNTSLLLNMTSSGVYDATSMSNLETVADAKLVATHTPYAGSFYSNYFDGTGDVFTVSNNSGFNFSSDFIIEAWLYPTAFGQGSCNFMTHWSSGSNVYVFRVLNNARVQFLYTAGATTLTGTSTTVSLNQWSHVAVCRSGSTLRIFVNGIADTTTATYSGTLTGGGPIAVGAHNDTSEGWTGYISNLRVVNTPSAPYTTTFTPSTTPLTSITGTALLTCQSNRFLDNSANAGTITKSGHVAVQSFNPFQRNSAATLYFDGSGDNTKALNIPPLASGDLTFEMWIYPLDTADRHVFSFGAGWSPANGISMIQYQGNFALTCGTGWAPASAGQAIEINGWHHIALVRNNTAVKVYYDGVLKASGTDSTNLTATAISIGYVVSSAIWGSFNGYINDLRITKGVARYTSTFTPPTTAFITK